MLKRIVFTLAFFLIIELILRFSPLDTWCDYHKIINEYYWNLDIYTNLFNRYSSVDFIWDRKNFGRTNDDSRPFSIPKPEGTVRIVCLGSSSTIGIGVPAVNSYPFELENLIEKDKGMPVEVFNGGIGGVGFTPLLIYFKDVLLKLSPDIVIVYFGGNGDWFGYEEYLNKAKYTLEKSSYIRDYHELVARMDLCIGCHEIFRIYYFLLEKSRLFRLGL